MNTITVIVVCCFIATACAVTRDVVIIGAGASGCVFAEKISRNPDVSVRVIEKGWDDSEFLRKTTGFYDQIYTGGFAAWVDPVFSNDPGRQIDYANPIILGGGSAVNGNYFQWPEERNLADWDSDLWTFDATLAARNELESYQGTISNASVHGLNGPITVNTFSPAELDQSIQFSASQIFNLGFDSDFSDQSAQGIGSAPRNIEVGPNGEGLREDSYTQLLKISLGRPNLELISGAEVLDIEIKDNGKHKVKYLHNAQIHTVNSNKELVISAGVFATPQLLLLNGIGPEEDLAELGIPMQVNQSFVGKNFFYKALTSQLHLNFIPTNFSKGYITSIFYDYNDQRNETNTMEVSIFCLPSSQLPGASACLAALSQHGLTSTGDLSIFNDNPNTNPQFKFNLYAETGEPEAMVDAFQKTRSVFQSLGSIEVSPSFAALPQTASDIQVEQYLRRVVGIEHAVGTCSMHQVVDERLRLLTNNGDNVPGIRIADTSIFPVGTTTHSAAATAFLVGARAAEIVAEEHDW